MSAWIEVVNADGSDEWLETCNAALVEVQRETRRRVRIALLGTTDGDEVDDAFEIPAGEIKRILSTFDGD